MPEKKFRSKAIIYSSDENGLGAHLYGEKSHSVTDVTIPPSFTKGAMVGDIVDVNVYIKSSRKRQRAAFVNAYTSRSKYHSADPTQGYGTIQSIISPTEFTIAGRVEEGNVHNMFIASSGSNLRATIFNSDMNGASAGDLVLATITRRPNGTIRASVSEILGDEKSYRSRYRAELLNGGLASGFAANALMEAEALDTKSIRDLTDEQLKDMRSKTLFTLSEDGDLPTKAYSFEKDGEVYKVGVYYSDAALYIDSESELETELFSRFSSLNLPHRDFHFMPELLRKKLCLIAGEDKPVFAVIMKLDGEGQCLSIDLENAIVNVSANGSLNEINELFYNNDKSEITALRKKYTPIISEIWTMFDLCASLTKDKTYEFCQLDGVNDKLYSFENEEVVSVDYPVPNDIGMMKNIIDTLVGVNLGKYVFDNNIPFLYETQLPPSYETLSALPPLNTPLVVDETTICRLLFMYRFVISNNADKKILAASINMRRSLPEVQSSTSPGPHFSLSQFGFVNFKDPSESYTDLTLLRVLKAYLKGADTETLANMIQLAVVSFKINGQRKKDSIIRLEQLVNDSLALKNGSLTVNAFVTMVDADGAEIMLPNGAFGFIPISEIKDGVYNRTNRTIESGDISLTFGSDIKAIATDKEYFTKEGILVDSIYKLIS